MNGLYDQILNNGQDSSLAWVQILVSLPAIESRHTTLSNLADKRNYEFNPNSLYKDRITRTII